MQERRKEFAFEGLWYNDMRRNGTAFITLELLKNKFENHAADFNGDYDKYVLLAIA